MKENILVPIRPFTPDPVPPIHHRILKVFRNGRWFGMAEPVRTSKYKPHQGEKEKARRRRQVERGII